MATDTPQDSETPKTSRRQFLTAIGMVAGSDTLYQAMTTLGFGSETQYGAPDLAGARPGTTVLILGAGLAGMTAAYELNKAGYKVRILEYQNRAGGRNWSLYGGDTYTELGGATQKVGFTAGNYLNPGPWRIPFHHRALLHYCKQFNVALEPFIQFNHNAYVHSTDAFAGKPIRFMEGAADFEGNVAELLAKAVNQKALDQDLSLEDRHKLLEALRMWGVLDKDMLYKTNLLSASHRGYDRAPGGGVDGAPLPSKPYKFSDVLDSGIWRNMAYFMNQEMQTTMFQPVGGMGMIGKTFQTKLAPGTITHNAKVTKIIQDKSGVTVTYTDTGKGGVTEAKADFCVVAVPLSVLNQIENNLSATKKAAIQAVPYGSSVKVGLEMKRRFWEEDDYIYGGHSFTNQDISLISYPNNNFFKDGPAVVLGAYAGGRAAMRLTGMTPEERIEAALYQGSVFHPKSYRKEFMTGASVAWNRVPWTLGSCGQWSEDARKTHYQNVVSVENRIVLAGEHASYVGCWMEGAVLSSLDAIKRLHKRALEA
jgi:monoamine oxidase